MAEQKTFSIKIDGIQQSIKGVESLGTNVTKTDNAFKDTQKALKAIKGEMAGLPSYSKEWNALAKQAGEYKDKLDDINQATRRFASDTKSLDDAINIGQSMTSTITLVKGAMSEFGIETEGAVEAIQKLQAGMAIIQSLQTLQNTMKGSTATAEAMNIAMKALTFGIEGTSVAAKTLKLSLATLGIGAVMLLVDELIENWDELVDEFNKSFPYFEEMGGTMNVLGATLKGLGAILINWIINPWKTFAAMVAKVLKGDFAGAVKEGIEGLKNQSIGVIDAFTNTFNKKINKSLEERTQKTKEEAAKQAKFEVERYEAIYGADKKYTEEHIKLKQKEFEARRKAAEGDKEELRKIYLEELNFNRQVKEAKEKSAEQGKETGVKYTKEEIDERAKAYDAFIKSMMHNEEVLAKYKEELNAKEKKTNEERQNLAKAEYDRRMALLNAEIENVKQIKDEKQQQELIQGIEKTKLELTRERQKEEAKIAAANKLGVQVSELENMRSMYMTLNDEQRAVLDTLQTQCETIDTTIDTSIKKLENANKKSDDKDKKKDKGSSIGGNKFKDFTPFGEDGIDLDRVGKDIEDAYDAYAAPIVEGLGDSIHMMMEMAIEEAEAALEEAEQMHDEAVDKVEESKDRLSELNDKMRESSGAQLEQYKQQMADEMLLLQQREQEERRLQKEKEKREKELEKQKKKARKLELMQQLSEAIVSGALAVVNGLATKPFVPVGIAMGALAGTSTAIQIATITKQISKLADGGLLNGKSHSQGGIPVGNTGIEVEGGEYVINKRSTAKYLPLLQQINEEGARRKTVANQIGKYADGGQLNYDRINYSLDALNTAKMVSNAISGIDIHPYVTVTDINRGQRNLVEVRELAGASN